MSKEFITRPECQGLTNSMAEQIKEVKKVVDTLTTTVNGLPNTLRLEMINTNNQLLKQFQESQASMLEEIKKSYSGKWVENSLIVIIKALGIAGLLGLAGGLIKMLIYLQKNNLI